MENTGNMYLAIFTASFFRNMNNVFEAVNRVVTSKENYFFKKFAVSDSYVCTFFQDKT